MRNCVVIFVVVIGIWLGFVGTFASHEWHSGSHERAFGGHGWHRGSDERSGGYGMFYRPRYDNYNPMAYRGFPYYDKFLRRQARHDGQLTRLKRMTIKDEASGGQNYSPLTIGATDAATGVITGGAVAQPLQGGMPSTEQHPTAVMTGSSAASTLQGMPSAQPQPTTVMADGSAAPTLQGMPISQPQPTAIMPDGSAASIVQDMPSAQPQPTVITNDGSSSQTLQNSPSGGLQSDALIADDSGVQTFQRLPRLSEVAAPETNSPNAAVTSNVASMPPTSAHSTKTLSHNAAFPIKNHKFPIASHPPKKDIQGFSHGSELASNIPSKPPKFDQSFTRKKTDTGAPDTEQSPNTKNELRNNLHFFQTENDPAPQTRSEALARLIAVPDAISSVPDVIKKRSTRKERNVDTSLEDLSEGVSVGLVPAQSAVLTSGGASYVAPPVAPVVPGAITRLRNRHMN